MLSKSLFNQLDDKLAKLHILKTQLMLVKLVNPASPSLPLNTDTRLYSVYITRNGTRVDFPVNEQTKTIEIDLYDFESFLSVKLEKNSKSTTVTTPASIYGGVITVISEASTETEYTYVTTYNTYNFSLPIVSTAVYNAIPLYITNVTQSTVVDGASSQVFNVGIIRVPSMTNLAGLLSVTVLNGSSTLIQSSSGLTDFELAFWTGLPIVKVEASGGDSFLTNIYYVVVLDAAAYSVDSDSGDALPNVYPYNAPLGQYGYLFYSTIFVPVDELTDITNVYPLYQQSNVSALNSYLSTNNITAYVVSLADVELAYHENDLDRLIAWNVSQDGGFTDESIVNLKKTIADRFLLRQPSVTSNDLLVRQYLTYLSTGSLDSDVRVLTPEYLAELKTKFVTVTASVTYMNSIFNSLDYLWILARLKYALVRNKTNVTIDMLRSYIQLFESFVAQDSYDRTPVSVILLTSFLSNIDKLVDA